MDKAAVLRRALQVLLEIVIPLAGFLTGLQAPRGSARWLWGQRSLLVRSLLALLVIVPLGTVLLTRALALSPVARAGILVAIIAIGIGPVAVYRHASKAPPETVSYAVGLNVTLLVASIAFIPGFLALHGALFHHDVRLAVGRVAGVVLTRALIPLVAGLGVARLLPRVVEPVARYASWIVNVSVAIVVVVALVATGRSLVAIGARAWLACAAVALGAVAVGDALGGPEPGTRRVLARSSALRFPALALLIASAIPDGRRVLPVVLAYILTSTLVTALHELAWTRRAHRVALAVGGAMLAFTGLARAQTAPSTTMPQTTLGPTDPVVTPSTPFPMATTGSTNPAPETAATPPPEVTRPEPPAPVPPPPGPSREPLPAAPIPGPDETTVPAPR